jgi:uncharacterized protein (TIGR02118 family)
MEATILLARRPAEADDTWLRRSLVALALRFRGARVRLLVADAEANAATTGVRAAPPSASFDTLVLVERVKSRWTAAPPSAAVQHDDALGWLAGARGYRALVRELRPRETATAAAQRSPGLVFAAVAMRAPQLSHGEFDAHWRDHHAPLALQHHAGLCGYEQLAVDGALTANAAPIDGVALLRFPSHDAFTQRFYDSDAGRDAVLTDTRKFLDLARCEAALMSEYCVSS